jgi:hypothetical protein
LTAFFFTFPTIGELMHFRYSYPIRAPGAQIKAKGLNSGKVRLCRVSQNWQIAGSGLSATPLSLPRAGCKKNPLPGSAADFKRSAP